MMEQAAGASLRSWLNLDHRFRGPKLFELLPSPSTGGQAHPTVTRQHPQDNRGEGVPIRRARGPNAKAVGGRGSYS